MRKINILLPVAFVLVLLALTACGGGSDKPPASPPAETVGLPTPPVTKSATSIPESTKPPDAESILAMGTEKLTEQVMDSPELMTCISE